MSEKRRTGQLLINAINGRLVSLRGVWPKTDSSELGGLPSRQCACKRGDEGSSRSSTATPSGLSVTDNPLFY